MIKILCENEILSAQTLDEARDALLSLAEASDKRVEATVLLSEGEYALSEPFVLNAKVDSALSRLAVTVKAEEGAHPIVHSFAELPTDAFTPVEGKPYYVYQMEKDASGEYPRSCDFYLDGEKMQMARSRQWRNPFALLREERRAEKELEGLYIPPDVAKTLAEGGIGSAQLRMYVQWEHTILHISHVDFSVTKPVRGEDYVLLKMGPEFQRRYVCGIHGANNTGERETFITNALGFLCEEGTYVYDWTTGLLYVVPKKEMSSHRVSYATLENLFILRGMKDVRIEGIGFTGVTSKFVCDNGYTAFLFNSERYAGRLSHAAILTVDVTDFCLSGCSFRGFGANAIQMRRSTRGARITNSRFVNVGMSAIYVGSYSKTYEIPDPRTVSDELRRNVREHISYDIRVENNYFEHIGYDYPNANCVHYYLVDGMKVLHNTIMGCAYSGISSGTGWRAHFVPGEFVNVRNVEVAYNRIHNFMDCLRDGAAIYTIGANSVTGYSARFNSVHHNYVSLENSKDHDRRGYYLDGSTTNWEVYDNVVENSLIPLFNQYHVTEQFTHHIRIDRIYSTTPIDIANNAPHRDSILLEYFVETDGIEALCERHPNAKAICEGAGCTLTQR